MTRSFATDRPQTFSEELANCLSHGLGFLLAVASLPILVVFAAQRGSAASVVGACVFSLTMMLLYFASTMYHALPIGRAKQVFNKLDHASIYLFIAGSYTPFALGALRGGWGWTLFGLVWGFAVLGVLLKSFNRLTHPWWSTALYVAMGWLVLIAAGPLVQHVAFKGLVLLTAGGLAYTAGAVVFLFDSRIRYAHFVWHLFVMGGSTCHFFAALWYAQ
ncbi:MAG: hemolysin III family protein [Betaproteobacteria bacterium]|nr:MAG: hemolysin III family protein [Betaproteobacteria bacterium]